MHTRDFLYKEDYYLPFSRAKNLPSYCCIKQDYLDNVQTIIDNDIVDDIPSNNVPIIVQLGCLGIQLTLTNSFNHVEAGYLVWIRNTHGWSEYSYTGDTVVITDNLEEDMYHILMTFALEEQLTWSYPNNIEYITKNQMGIEKCPLCTVVYATNKDKHGITYSFAEISEEDRDINFYNSVFNHDANTNISLIDLDELHGIKYDVAIIHQTGSKVFLPNLTATEVYNCFESINITDFVNIFKSNI